jgi:hypothetical protein
MPRRHRPDHGADIGRRIEDRVDIALAKDRLSIIDRARGVVIGGEQLGDRYRDAILKCSPTGASTNTESAPASCLARLSYREGMQRASSDRVEGVDDKSVSVHDKRAVGVAGGK